MAREGIRCCRSAPSTLWLLFLFLLLLLSVRKNSRAKADHIFFRLLLSHGRQLWLASVFVHFGIFKQTKIKKKKAKMSLGKRSFRDFAQDFEQSMTEFYRRECLSALFTTAAHQSRQSFPPPHKRKTKSVSFRKQLFDVIGSADPLVDRRPILVSPISREEMLRLLNERKFP